MASSARLVADTVRRTVSTVLTDRGVIVVAGVLAAATPVVPLVRQLGARDVLVVALSTGTGDLPDPSLCTCLVTASARPAPTIDKEIRCWQEFVDSPPRDVRAAVDRFDPAGEAVVAVLIPVTLDDGYLGRATYGGRPPGYTLLEDKTTNDTLWAAAGVVQAPYTVVPTEETDLCSAAEALDAGQGTVWSADARDSWSGGGGRVWWVRSVEHAEEATAAVHRCARQVRIMPFLEGVPCSIHGLVLPDGVAVFRPVELLVFRTPTLKFCFAGVSTWWDPPLADRQEMRVVARRTGAHLDAICGYRGAFCVDGVLTRDGFRPTELNPRFSAGLNVIAASWPDLPLRWAHDLAVRGVDLGVSASDVEEAMTARADAHRVGVAQAAPPRGTADTTDGVEVVLPSSAHGKLEIGPSTHGVFVQFTPADLVVGQRLAPIACEAFAEANRRWDVGFPPLDPAPEMRR